MVIYNAPYLASWYLRIQNAHGLARSIGGKLKTDYRYSAGLVYNTLPIPELSESSESMLEDAVFEMLDVREEEGGNLG